MDIKQIQLLCSQHKIRWTQHIMLRLTQRRISMDDVNEAIMSGEIIENYPDDYPDPSCLIFGLTSKNKSLHVVCGIHESELWLITAYHPDKAKWSNDFKQRKE